MALKKSELYSSLWKSCDELRGGMDASQYKDYVLVLLFVKYVSDKYAGDQNAFRPPNAERLSVSRGRRLRKQLPTRTAPDRGADTGAALNPQAENQPTSWCHPGQMLATMPRTIRSTRAAPSE